jgi:hypothetical protein
MTVKGTFNGMNNSPQTMAGLSTISAVFLMIQRCEEMLEKLEDKRPKGI